MKGIKVAAAALNQTPMAWEHNTNNIIQAIKSAKDTGVELLCLPELCITGYGCEDMFHSKDVLKRAQECLTKIAGHTHGIAVSVGLPVELNGAIFNTACMINSGNILGFVAKKYLAGDGIHYEPRWFKAWPKGVKSVVKVGNRDYPIGDIYFSLGNVNPIKVGFEICEDAWVYDRPGRQLASRGVDVILNPSASHFAFGKHEIRKGFVVEGSRAFNCVYVYANLLGNESGRVIYDGDTIVATNGNIVSSGERFSYEDFLITPAIVDIHSNNTSRSRTASFIPNVEADDLCIDGGSFCPKFHVPEFLSGADRTYEKHEEFQKAVSLGLFDFMRKAKSNGYVVSLSGGADSSAVSCLVYLMVKDAVNNIGHNAFKKKLSYIPSIQGLSTIKDIANKLLNCAYQGSKNSSDTTYTAAQKVAEALGAEFHNLDISGAVSLYTGMIEKSIGRKLTWEQDDVTLQNIQARVRGPSVWMLANIKNAILLATSNRSEAAVGYATMDGDTCGGLSPIAGIDKNYLRMWLRQIETTIPALSYVNNQEPTAELRPSEKNQKDEDDLMPYGVLDQLEKHAIRDKRSPVEIFLLMQGSHDKAQLGVWIEKFFKLWCRNQWKRERYAPSFHLDDENLDPKTWCRFPIISSGFEQELIELRSLVSGEYGRPSIVNNERDY
jgi:NAD+ synthase (glutamine-hydrolysing)